MTKTLDELHIRLDAWLVAYAGATRADIDVGTVRDARDALRELIADAERLNQENFALAAGQCIVPVGGLYGDDRGHQHCGLQKKLERTEQLLKEALSEQISRQQDEDDNQVPDAAFGQCPTCGEYSQSAKELRRHRRRP